MKGKGEVGMVIRGIVERVEDASYSLDCVFEDYKRYKDVLPEDVYNAIKDLETQKGNVYRLLNDYLRHNKD